MPDSPRWSGELRVDTGAPGSSGRIQTVPACYRVRIGVRALGATGAGRTVAGASGTEPTFTSEWPDDRRPPSGYAEVMGYAGRHTLVFVMMAVVRGSAPRLLGSGNPQGVRLEDRAHPAGALPRVH